MSERTEFATGLTHEESDVDSRSDVLAKWMFFVCALLSVLTTLIIVLILVRGSVNFFTEVSIVEFFTGTDWSPLIKPRSYGVLPLINGTLIIAVGSSLIALPIGTATAIYLSEYADPQIRNVVKPVLEILAGIPTIVYGFFAISFITPIIKSVFPSAGTFNAASACIVVGVMILPMVSSLSEDAMSAVPDSLRQAGYGMGATKFEVSTGIVVPASVSGILSSYILAVSRAIGETMAVTLAAGMRPNMTLNPLKQIQTMTAYMVQVGVGDVSVGSIGYQSLYAVGMTLFVMTLAMNLLSVYVKSRHREVYR